MPRSAVSAGPLGCQFGNGQNSQWNRDFLQCYTSVRRVAIRESWLNANADRYIDLGVLSGKANAKNRAKNNIAYVIARMITESSVPVIIQFKA